MFEIKFKKGVKQTMKGTLINANIISGDDNQRYKIQSQDDFLNLNGMSIESLLGCRVDFDIQGDRAVLIHIYNVGFFKKLKVGDIQSIKSKARLSIGSILASVLVIFPLMSFLFNRVFEIEVLSIIALFTLPIFFIISGVLRYFALAGIKEHYDRNDNSLLTSFYLMFGCAFVLWVLYMSFFYIPRYTQNEVYMIFAVLGWILLMIYVASRFVYYDKLSTQVSDKFDARSFWFFIIVFIFAFLFILGYTNGDKLAPSEIVAIPVVILIILSGILNIIEFFIWGGVKEFKKKEEKAENEALEQGEEKGLKCL